MTETKRRTPLTRDRVLETAVELADAIGMDGFTIRKLAAALNVGPMSIYHHLRSKEAIIDGMVEIVFGEIRLPPQDQDWKSAIRARCVSAREVLLRHTWAAPLMESRLSPGPVNLRHHDTVLGCLRRGGLSMQMTAHAYAILDAYIYGFAFEEATLPGGDDESLPDIAAAIVDAVPVDQFPNLAEFTVDHVLQPGYNFGDSFEFGLDLIIEGIDRAAKHGS